MMDQRQRILEMVDRLSEDELKAILPLLERLAACRAGQPSPGGALPPDAGLRSEQEERAAEEWEECVERAQQGVPCEEIDPR